MDEAIESAAAGSASGKQKLDIIGDAEFSGNSVDVTADMTVTVTSGVTLKINKSLQVNNRGTIIVEPGANVHKFGSLLNEGAIVINEGSAFTNYGSAFVDHGRITGKQNIICKPHLYGDWTCADTPDGEGKWKRTRICNVCEHTDTSEVPKNPPAENVKSIEISREPDQTTWDVGEAFEDTGLLVTATLNDGTRATVTDYTLALKLGESEGTPIRNGDILNEEGTGKVIISYDKFRADYDIVIINMPELLNLTDESGNAITEAAMEAGESLSLKASLKFRLPYTTRFKWETDDESIVSLAGDTGANMTVKALEPGSASITVSVLDERGNPVEGIRSRTVNVGVESHITEIKLPDNDISIDKGQSYEIKPEISPIDATDKLAWSSSDERVAVVDENGKVNGIGGGKARITVTAPNGLSDSVIVSVNEKANDLTINPEEIEIDDNSFDVIWAEANNAGANGEVRWTITDTEKAGFYVKNEQTGEMETVGTVTTRLSAGGEGPSDTYVIIAGIRRGTTVVTAQTESESGETITKRCIVTVKSSEKYVHITHNGSSISGEEMKLDLAGLFIQLGAESSEDNDTFTWTVIDDQADPVIRVNNTGKVILRRKGTAAVQVTSNLTGEKDICLITVVSRPSSVELSENEIKLPIGSKKKLTAKLMPEGSEGAIVWRSSDESVAEVSDTGEVTAVGDGEATIYADPDVQGAQGATCKVTVVSDIKPEVELSETSYIYDGNVKLPKITVRSGDKVLGSEITESNDKVIVVMDEAQLPGSYTVTVIARDWAYGSANAGFRIQLKPTDIVNLEKGTNEFTVQWNKIGQEYISGYQIRYSSLETMAKSETKTVATWDKSILTLDDIKGGYTYYVQMRTYLDRGSIRFYSDWSEIQPVTVEKAGSTDNTGSNDSTNPVISEKKAEKTITGMKTDKDPKGSEFGKLRLRSLKQTGTSVKLQWTKIAKAKKYVVYGNRCGKNLSPKKLVTMTGNVKTIKLVAGKKVKPGASYKFIVAAIDKNKNVVSISKLIHVSAKSKKIGNYKGVSIKKATLKKAQNLKKNKTLKLAAKVVLQSKKLKVRKHIGLRYESTNNKIATVSSKGVIKAKKKGQCFVYVYAQNGVFKKVKVVVK